MLAWGLLLLVLIRRSHQNYHAVRKQAVTPNGLFKICLPFFGFVGGRVTKITWHRHAKKVLPVNVSTQGTTHYP